MVLKQTRLASSGSKQGSYVSWSERSLPEYDLLIVSAERCFFLLVCYYCNVALSHIGLVTKDLKRLQA